MPGDYEDILKKSWKEIPQPQVLPGGTWRLKTDGVRHMEAKSAGQKDQVLFVFVPKEPLDDVEADLIDELGPGYDFAANRIFYKVFVETAADWDKVRKLLIKLGNFDEDASIEESLKAAKGTEVLALMGVRNYTTDDGEAHTDNTVSSFVAVED